MLTNNNKFVRSIAMLLAMLMVMALCLTGCGNKDGSNKSDIAEDVKAALADYLTTPEAEAKVAALVDAALADGTATKAEIEALSAQLANYVTVDSLAELITQKVAAGAIEGLMSRAEIEEELKKYYTKEEVDAKFADYFGEFDAEAVRAILTSADKAMNKAEWDEATGIVLETIKNVQVLLKALEEDTYTQTNMKKVNACMDAFGIVVFQDADEDDLLDALKGDALAVKEISKLIEYAILRQATKEDMDELKAVVAEAVAVPTFESSFKALKADLLGLGDLHVVGNYNTATNVFEPAKYAVKTNYHGEEFKKDDAVKVQIVTLADKAGFHAFAKAHDALLAEYYADETKDDKALATGKEGWIDGLTARELYEVTKTGATGGVSLELVDLGNDPSTTDNRKLGLTVITNANIDYLEKMYQNNLEENEVVLSPLYSFTAALNKGNYTTDYKATGTFEEFYNDLAADQSNENVWKTAYTLVYNQLLDVQGLADDANEIFADDTVKSFLKDTVQAGTISLVSKKYAEITDAEFLAALTAAMCEPLTTPVAGTIYLLDDVQPVVKKFLTANGLAYDPTIGGFDKGVLYDDMLKKSFDLLWDKYQVEAIEWANIILKDYISVVYEAVNNAAGALDANGNPTAQTNNVAISYATLADLVDGMNNPGTTLVFGEKVTAADLTADFLKAFVEGGTVNGVYAELDLDEKFVNSNLQAFYTNNAAAKTPVVSNDKYKVEATAIYANPLASIAKDAEYIRQLLTSAMLYTQKEIATADIEAAKASGVDVREAFYSLLKKGVADLDEIYARFLFEDYKLMTFNEMAVKAVDLATFYNKNVDVLGKKDAQVAAIQRYLTGVASNATKACEFGITNDDIRVGMNVAFNSDKNSADYKKVVGTPTYKTNDLEASLTNGFLAVKLAPITVNVWAAANQDGTAEEAKAKMAEVKAIVDEATATIENMLIKDLFVVSYLKEARNNIFAANNDHDAVLDVTDWNNRMKLVVEQNAAKGQITVTELTANRESYKLGDYKSVYIENVLTLIAHKSNLHVALLSGKSIDEIINMSDADLNTLVEDTFEDLLKNVRSADDDKTWVIGKYSPYTTEDTYEFVGTYAVNLDMILNTLEGRATTYEDESGIHNLY